MPSLKPVIVGEANPYGGDPYFAMYPSPERSSGHRLCRLVLEMDEDEYLDRFERVNLCHREWRIKEARERAKTLIKRDLILLGSKVCGAFGVPYAPFCHTEHKYGVVVVLPHPSGRCMAWNEFGAFERARDCVLEALPELANAVGVLP